MRIPMRWFIPAILVSLCACTARPEAVPGIEEQPAAPLQDKMMDGARKLMSVSAGVQPGEDVLIVTDAPT